MRGCTLSSDRFIYITISQSMKQHSSAAASKQMSLPACLLERNRPSGELGRGAVMSFYAFDELLIYLLMRTSLPILQRVIQKFEPML